MCVILKTLKFLLFVCCYHSQWLWSQISVRFARSPTVSQISANSFFLLFFLILTFFKFSDILNLTFFKFSKNLTSYFYFYLKFLRKNCNWFFFTFMNFIGTIDNACGQKFHPFCSLYNTFCDRCKLIFFLNFRRIWNLGKFWLFLYFSLCCEHGQCKFSSIPLFLWPFQSFKFWDSKPPPPLLTKYMYASCWECVIKIIFLLNL